MEGNLNKIDNIKSANLINNFSRDENIYINQIPNSNNLSDNKINNKSNNINNNININTLFKAVQENNINEIEQNLIKDNSNINALNSNGLSLLHLSVIKGNIQIVNKLLKYGANPNILSLPNKQTPLHLAYLSQESTKDDIINTLLSYNADKNIMDLYDNKPSDYKYKYNKKDLNTPDRKNKIKKEDLYYKVNDININFFSTSDVKKKTSNKKSNEKEKDNCKINNVKCNRIITPKKIKEDNLDSIKSESNYNFGDLKNLDIHFRSINIKDNDLFNNNQNINTNVNNNIFKNNESIKDINIYEKIDNVNDNNFKENINNNLYNSKENEISENNILNDSLEEINENNQNYDNIFNNFKNDNNNNIDNILKEIITNKRKSIAERSSSKKRSNSNLANTTNTFLKNNIFININNSNNSCTYISTQNQTSQKKFSFQNKDNINITNDKNKIISEYKYNSLINSNLLNNKNKNSFDNNISNENDNIIQKINKNRIIFKNWLNSINMAEFYENFLENEIYDINQFLKISKNKTPNELFNYINSILHTKKYGYIYRIICKLEIDTKLLDNKLINFLAPDFKSKKNNDFDLSISGGKNVLCGRNNKNIDKDEKNIFKIFLNKNGLNKFYQNFYHNGFDIFEFVIIQMFSQIPINDFILENYLHIYIIEDRKKVLNALIKEKERVNKFINSEEFLNNKIKKGYKYENFVLEHKNDIQFIINNDDKRCNLCYIY